MGENDMKWILTKYAELAAEQMAIGNKMASLELAYETLTGKTMPDVEPREAAPKRKPTARRQGNRTGRKVDRQGNEKTLAFLVERGRPTTVKAVANKFGISTAAATQRCRSLVKLHKVERIEQGVYATLTKGRPSVPMASA